MQDDAAMAALRAAVLSRLARQQQQDGVHREEERNGNPSVVQF